VRWLGGYEQTNVMHRGPPVDVILDETNSTITPVTVTAKSSGGRSKPLP
jgi:hypothetical protein